MSPRAAALRSLPSVDRLLRHAHTAALLERYPRELVTATLRRLLDEVRAAATQGSDATLPDGDTLVSRAAELLAHAATPTLRPVVNASGVVLHTNLGRAALAA